MHFEKGLLSVCDPYVNSICLLVMPTKCLSQPLVPTIIPSHCFVGKLFLTYIPSTCFPVGNIKTSVSHEITNNKKFTIPGHTL